MKYLIYVYFFALLGCANTHIPANALIVADWGQTRYIAGHEQYIETNPILGKHPSKGEVNMYFASALVAYNVVYYITPERHRDKVSTVVSLVQLSCVAHNYRMGVKFDF